MKIFFGKYIIFVILFQINYQLTATENIPIDDLSDCTNYVLIQGSSNINEFEFINYQPNIQHDTNAINIYSVEQEIQIPVLEFSGENSMMLKDFHKMLNAQKYPYINIEIESLNSADFDETTGLTNFITKISIAGNTRTYNIACQLIDCEQSGKVVKGTLQLELTDFNIDPPKKVFGVIKVHDEVFIKFAFHYL